MAAATGATYTRNHEPSFWLHLRLVDLRTRWLTGQVLGCPHVRRGQPFMAALWAPGKVTCLHCAEWLAGLATGDEAQTCDRCRTVGPIHPCAVEFGAAMVAYGLCPACHDRDFGR